MCQDKDTSNAVVRPPVALWRIGHCTGGIWSNAEIEGD